MFNNQELAIACVAVGITAAKAVPVMQMIHKFRSTDLKAFVANPPPKATITKCHRVMKVLELHV